MGILVARWQGAQVARCAQALVRDGVHLVPREAVTAELIPTTRTRATPDGEALVYDLNIGGAVLSGGAWSWPRPPVSSPGLASLVALGPEIELSRDPSPLDDAPASVLRQLAAGASALDADPWFLVDADDVVRVANEPLRRLCATDPRGRSLRQLLDDVGLEALTVQRGLDERGCWQRQSVPLRDGAPHRVSIQRLVGGVDALCGVRGRLRDVSDLEHLGREVTRLEAFKAQLYRLLEERTREADEALEHLTLIIDNISDAFLVTDPGDRVKLINPAVLHMFGVDELVVGQPIAEHFEEALVAVVAEARHAQTASAEVVLPDDRVAKAVSNAIYSDGGSQLGVVTVVRDITFEKEVDRMKSDFIANVSHELRTPLTSILGFARIIEKRFESLLPLVDDATPRVSRHIQQTRKNLRIVVTEGERLTRLVNDVLDISKMEAGRTEWKTVSTDINDVVRHAVSVSRPLFADTEVALKLELAPELPPLEVDRERLIQVVINLVSNAAKFTHRGSVTCITAHTDAGIEVAVEDTGVGIADEDLPTVFEKFRQVGSTLTDKPIGTGLGLPLCRHIVEHHGGTIRVRSSVGVGSRFTFVLPIPGPRP